MHDTFIKHTLSFLGDFKGVDVLESHRVPHGRVCPDARGLHASFPLRIAQPSAQHTQSPCKMKKFGYEG